MFEAKGTSCSFEVSVLCLPANIYMFAQISLSEIKSSQLPFVKIESPFALLTAKKFITDQTQNFKSLYSDI